MENEPGEEIWEPAPIDGETQEQIERYGLPLDYFNFWSSPAIRSGTDLSLLEQIPTFEEYISKMPIPEASKAYILQASNTEKINELNTLAENFNANLDRIKREGDSAAAKDFYIRAIAIRDRK